jgi:hypothetical protein
MGKWVHSLGGRTASHEENHSPPSTTKGKKASVLLYLHSFTYIKVWSLIKHQELLYLYKVIVCSILLSKDFIQAAYNALTIKISRAASNFFSMTSNFLDEEILDQNSSLVNAESTNIMCVWIV